MFHVKHTCLMLHFLTMLLQNAEEYHRKLRKMFHVKRSRLTWVVKFKVLRKMKNIKESIK